MSDKDEEQRSSSDGREPGFLAKAIDATPPSWKQKLAKGLAQILVATESGAAIYSEAKEKIDYVEGRSLINKRLAQHIAEQAVHDPEMVERAKARMLGDMMKGQENIEAVLELTPGQMLALPSPETGETPVGETENGANRADNRHDDEEPLDQDWAAAFSDYAAKANSQELRERLARILAGEIQSPGLYSRATVRGLVELEQADLKMLQAALPYVVGYKIFPVTVPSKQPSLSDLILLEEAGLTVGANSDLESFWENPSDSAKDETHFVIGRDWCLLFKLKPGHRLAFPACILTKTGVAAADLLGRQDERAVLRRLARDADKSAVTTLKLCRIVGNTFSEVEHLFPEPIVTTLS